MRCRALRGVVLALLLSVPLFGCEIETIEIQLPGYGDGSIDGIWLWKPDPAVSGSWQRVCRIDFTDRLITEDGETLAYVQNCINGREVRGVVFPAQIERLAADPSTVVVDLIYLRYEDPGTYRATAFNESGESALSTTTLTL